MPEEEVDAFHAGQRAIEDQQSRIRNFLAVAAKRLGVGGRRPRRQLEEGEAGRAGRAAR